MIGKTIKGTRFRGVLAYLLSDEKVEHEGARIIGGTVQTGSVADIADEFEGIRLLAPRRKHVVYHQILRPPPGEGEALSDATWLEIAADHAGAMGYRDGQWIVVRHHNHIHIVANRVLLDGSVVSDSNDWARAERSVRAIEKKFGLTQVESSHLLEPEKAKEHERAPVPPWCGARLERFGLQRRRADNKNAANSLSQRRFLSGCGGTQPTVPKPDFIMACFSPV